MVNKITDITLLSTSLKVNTTIFTLSLGGNRIDSLTSLSEALKVNQSITNLSLDNNRLDSDSITSLSDGLSINRGIITLSLCDNRLSSAASLIEALKSNDNIEYLYTQGNKISSNEIGRIFDQRILNIQNKPNRNASLFGLLFNKFYGR